MRSSRVPARTASTTARTAARTSSSASEAVRTVVRSGVTGGAPGPSHAGRDPEPGQRLVDLGVGIELAGEPDDHLGGEVLRQGHEEPGGVQRKALGQVHDERPELGPDPDRVGKGGGLEQVFLVGPGGREPRPDRAVQPHHLGRPPGRAGERVERGRRSSPAAPGRWPPAPTRWPGAGGRVRTARGRRPARPASPRPARAWTPAACPGPPGRPRRAARPAGRW